MQRRFVAVDLETSGLDPTVHEIMEVGLVAELTDGTTNEEAFSLPFNSFKASPRALEVNGWGKRPFAKLQDEAWAIGFLETVLDDVHLVGKNPHFDAGFLQALFAKHGKKPVWHHRLVDVGALAWGYHSALMVEDEREDLVSQQPPNVVQAGQLIGARMSAEDYHTALGDARWAYRAFRTCVPWVAGVQA